MAKVRSLKSLIKVGICAAALVAGAAPAWAQTVDEEIVVTATRRSENLQDVPLSVAAVSAEKLETILAGGGDALALAGRVPGLNVESSNGRVAPRFYIRGLGNTDFDLAASQPVSVIMDGVVMENVALKSFPLFDIEQVEVLRGPQGTLFGRNTPAGIVSLRSAGPTKERTGRISASYGTYGTSSLEGAVGGSLTNTISARAAVLVAHRDDWIDNGFNGQKDAIGGYDEVAGRVQFLFEPTENFDALLNLHGRSLDGTSTIFRANVFTAGSNQLNNNFNRDRVFYNQGRNNPQQYESYGAGLTMNYDLGGATITSITGYDTAEGFSLGDIDGGVAGVGPGLIPFDSSTQDNLNDLRQFTQEIRIASPDEGRLTWQAGVYYFDSSFEVTTVGAGFPPPATVKHENTSWAVFAQAEYDISDRLSVAGGVRYTEDEKDFIALAAPLLPVAAPPGSPNAFPAARTVSDEQVSWDLSVRYEVTPDVNVYGRVANGFRAPSIQGRDVAFGSLPSVADSETIQSYEAGVKSDVLGGTGRINAAVFYYEIEDQQFSAIGGAGNLTQLVNADKGEGYGFEIDSSFDVTERLNVGVGFAYNHTEIKDATLTVAPCGSGQCTVLDPIAPGGFARVNGNPFPQAPEYTLDLSARYERPMGERGAIFADTDWTVRGETNLFLYDAAEFRIESQFEGGLRVGYAGNDGAYEVAVFARNITDEENVIGGIDFNNLTGFVNEPRIIGVSLSAKLN
ncbi:MAG: TonB-dependent receptor [Alphaproteobacteria bacterium]|nr:TonB-dependent receptor [Alphaproteobacteria bacterium]